MISKTLDYDELWAVLDCANIEPIYIFDKIHSTLAQN